MRRASTTLRRLMWACMAAATMAAVCSSSPRGVMAQETAGEDDEGVEEERFEFQAEVSRLMDIFINSLYTNREIFLREIISNSADALDKIRFLSLQDDTVLGEGENRDLDIRISYDKDAHTITIRDRGIGMTKQDLIQNLGTVAKSGTAQFVEQVASGADMSQIGQFGVGFYSVYLVADKVVVRSKHNEDSQHVWESSADGTFVVRPDTGESLERGTEITIFLKDDSHEFIVQDKLESLIKRYSEFINFPIYLHKSRVENREVPADEEEEEEALDTETVDDEEETSKKTKTESVTVWEWEQVNNQQAIWKRSKSDVTDEEYKKFYKSFSKDYDDPLAWIHFKAEGEIDFRSILYIPRHAPADMYDTYYGKTSALRLYVRKVLISDQFEELMPRYLNFMNGVVDSDDLPLNVNRETLQQHRVLKAIGKKLTRKALELLRKMSKDADAIKEAEESQEDGEEESAPKEDRYKIFWKQFGKSLKLGVIEDSSNRSKLAKLLRWQSTRTLEKGEDALTSFDEYVANMKSWQKDIYYIAGESVEALKDSPFLERFQAKGVEVLLMADAVDEYTVQNLADFDGHKLQSITKEGLKFGDEEQVDEKRIELYKELYEPLADYLNDLYDKSVEKVTITNRLATSPAILVTSQYGYSANMERIMKSQTFSDPERVKLMMSRKIMELNPRHPIISDLLRRVKEDSDGEQTRDLAWMLYDTALLNSGFTLDKPEDFAARMYRLMKAGMNLESLDLEPEIDVPEEPEEDTDVDEAEIEQEDEEEL